MAIRAGQILHAMNQFIVDRIQSGGAGNLNIPQERVFELGNFQSVGIVRDVPDLTFTLDVLDVGTEVEALLTGVAQPDDDVANPIGDGSSVAAAAYSLSGVSTVDVISPFKSAQGAFNIVKGVAVPQLSLEQVQYRYGMKANAGENYSLRGDSIYYVPGVPFQISYTGDGATTAYLFRTQAGGIATNEVQTVTITGTPTGGSFTLTFDGHTTSTIAFDALAATVRTALAALPNVNGSANVNVSGSAGGPYTVTFQGIFAGVDVPQMTATGSFIGGTSPAVAVVTATPGATTYVNLHALVYTELGASLYALNVSIDGVRQYPGTAYTETNAGVTFLTAPANNSKIRIVFGANKNASDVDIEVDYTQAVHAGLNVKPAAIRGRDIKVYVGGAGIGFLWHDVQSVEVNWRVNLDIDWEFGSAHAVNRDFIDPPDVTGTIELKAITVSALLTKLSQISGVDVAQVIGPNSSVTLPVIVQLLNPDSGGTSDVPRGTVLKTLYIPDARFVLPGYEGRVSQKLMSQLPFTSDKGLFTVFRGAPTAAQIIAYQNA